MFSWSSTRRGTAGSSDAGSAAGAAAAGYPGTRVAATTVAGSVRPPEYTRQQHLDSYLRDDRLKRSTRKVYAADDSTYDTVFQTVSGDTLVLRVHLPAPAAANIQPPPQFSLYGVQARHAWLDSRSMKVTGYAALQSAETWKESGLLLGAAVHEVVTYFQVHPPEIIRVTDPNLPQPKPKPPPRPTPNPPSPPPHYIDVLPDIDLPNIPSQFPELDNLSREELDELLEDELDFQTFCKNKIAVLQTIESIGLSVVEQNAEIAEKNLKDCQELKELHSLASSLQTKLKERVDAFQALEREQNKLAAPPDERKVVHAMNKAKKQAFDLSEKIAEDWLESDNDDADQFCSQFVQERKVHHLYAAKMELLQHASGAGRKR